MNLRSSLGHATLVVVIGVAIGASGPDRQQIKSPEAAKLANPVASTPESLGVGKRAYDTNCAACHGSNAQGGKGFPNLTTASWLWGGDPENIAETIRVGVNSAHPQTRTSQMMAFGRDQILKKDEIDNVVTYLRSLSDPAIGKEVSATKIDAGKAVFAANCVACHGDDAKGKADLGAPNLTDRFWIYGGDAESVYTTVWGGRQGHMPSWEGRLSPLDRKILALYLIDLRGEER